ncbi:MAG: acylphosphatase [Candidatus Bathyarchaeota archaeon]|nr:acylphosphatase [Candidatus Bathyarchaeota archaeon]
MKQRKVQTVKTRAHILVTGKVQGVFFRARTTERAFRLGVTGWIRNLPNGKLEAVFEGEKEAVDAAVEFCRHGPNRAVITEFDVKQEPFTGEFQDFRVRH